MFGYAPYRDPYSYSSSPSYSHPYYRALAEEQAARDQYAAALRAQQEARERAARARHVAQVYNPYASPYNSYLDDEDEGDGYTYGPGGYDPYAYNRESRRKELQELQRQREREEKLRQLEMERLRLLKEERRKRELAAEEERERLRRAEAAKDFYRQYGRGRMFPGEEVQAAQPDKIGNFGGRRAASTFPHSGTGAPKPAHDIRKPASPSPNPSRRTASARPLQQRTSIPIRTPSPQQPRPAQNDQIRSKPSPPAAQPRYSNEQVAAAENIQRFVRTHLPRHKALRQINGIEKRYEELRSGFFFPRIIDFSTSSDEDEVVHVDVDNLLQSSPPSSTLIPSPTLPYTHNNKPLHAYDHQLSQILTQLDEVPSGGDAKVRERRREVVRKVQDEVNRVEAWRMRVWSVWVESGKAQKGNNVTVTMEPSSEALALASSTFSSQENPTTKPTIVDVSPAEVTSELTRPSEEPAAMTVEQPTPSYSTADVDLPHHAEAEPLAADDHIDAESTEPSACSKELTDASPSPYALEPHEVVAEEPTPMETAPESDIQHDEETVVMDVDEAPARTKAEPPSGFANVSLSTEEVGVGDRGDSSRMESYASTGRSLVDDIEGEGEVMNIDEVPVKVEPQDPDVVPDVDASVVEEPVPLFKSHEPMGDDAEPGPEEHVEIDEISGEPTVAIKSPYSDAESISESEPDIPRTPSPLIPASADAAAPVLQLNLKEFEADGREDLPKVVDADERAMDDFVML